MKVFLGGTCNESTWREKLIPMSAFLFDIHSGEVVVALLERMKRS
jgi:hypothetical protein